MSLADRQGELPITPGTLPAATANDGPGGTGTRDLRSGRRRLALRVGLAAGVALALVGAFMMGLGARRNSEVPACVRAAALPSGPPHRVLLVDSYHEGYPWSEGIISGAMKELGACGDPDGVASRVHSGLEVRVERMDTKRNGSEEYKQQAGLRVKGVIESWRPNVVICCDDNAIKYIVVPWFRDGPIPFVFCGINWDASVYGLPCRNTTGMVEVSLINDMLQTLRPLARGNRVGVLGADNESNRKEAYHYEHTLGLVLQETVLVKDTEAWKAAYLDLQAKVDVLILAPPSFLADATPAQRQDLRQFILDSTTIPTGSVEDWIAPYSLVCYAKVPQEHGRWAAQAVLRILAGTLPKDIPVTANKEAAIHLNMPLAKRLGATFPVSLLQRAHLNTD